MKRFLSSSLAVLVAAVGCLAVGQTAQAATSWSGSWNYSNCSGSISWGNSYTCSDSSLPTDAQLNLSGWSSDLSPSSNFAAAAVYPWGSSSGFGVVSKEECNNSASVCDPGAGPHSADNLGNLDGFLLKFSDNPDSTVSVALNSIKVGWNGTDNATGNCSTNCTYDDSDISVYYYVGNNPPTDASAIKNMSASTLATLNSGGVNFGGTVNGWKLLNHYGNLGSAAENTVNLANNGGATSSWWLITASNQTVGTSTTTDAFKLLTVAGTGTTTNNTPEPGTLVLAGLAALGAVYSRRRRKD